MPTPRTPPKLLKINDAPAYIERKYGVEVTRQTMYNWIRRGVRGEKLRSTRKVNKLYTTEGWIDDFVDRIS